MSLVLQISGRIFKLLSNLCTWELRTSTPCPWEYCGGPSLHFPARRQSAVPLSRFCTRRSTRPGCCSVCRCLNITFSRVGTGSQAAATCAARWHSATPPAADHLLERLRSPAADRQEEVAVTCETSGDDTRALLIPSKDANRVRDPPTSPEKNRLRIAARSH